MVGSGYRIVAEHVKSGIYHSKIDGDFQIVDQQQQNGAVNGLLFCMHIRHQNQRRHIREGFYQKKGRKKKSKGMMGFLEHQQRKRQKKFEQDIQFNEQIFHRLPLPENQLSQVNTGKKKLHRNEKQPQNALQANVVVVQIFPNRLQRLPLFAYWGLGKRQIVLRLSEYQFFYMPDHERNIGNFLRLNSGVGCSYANRGLNNESINRPEMQDFPDKNYRQQFIYLHSS